MIIFIEKFQQILKMLLLKSYEGILWPPIVLLDYLSTKRMIWRPTKFSKTAHKHSACAPLTSYFNQWLRSLQEEVKSTRKSQHTFPRFRCHFESEGHKKTQHNLSEDRKEEEACLNFVALNRLVWICNKLGGLILVSAQSS